MSDDEIMQLASETSGAHYMDQAHVIRFARAVIDKAASAEPVAWQWLDTAHFRKRIPSNAVADEWRPLYAQTPSDKDVRGAAISVLEAWDHYGTAECLRGWIDILRDRLNAPPSHAASNAPDHTAAMQMALDWLTDEQDGEDEDCGEPTCGDCMVVRKRQVVIDALRAALGEKE